MQCASSITSRPSRPASASSTRGRSPGWPAAPATRAARRARRPRRSSRPSPTRRCSWSSCVAARRPARAAAATWSRISASSGDTTSVGPPAPRAGSRSPPSTPPTSPTRWPARRAPGRRPRTAPRPRPPGRARPRVGTGHRRDHPLQSGAAGRGRGTGHHGGHHARCRRQTNPLDILVARVGRVRVLSDSAGPIAAAYDLGSVLDFTGPVARGEQGEVWRLRTDRGVWAVKRSLGLRRRGRGARRDVPEPGPGVPGCPRPPRCPPGTAGSGTTWPAP